MNLKHYIVLDVDEMNTRIKMKLVKGFTRDQSKEVLNVQSGWVPQGDDILYFFPGCSVPRFKVREKFTCTIKPGNATAAFISDNLAGSDSTFDWYPQIMKVEYNEIINFLDKLCNFPGIDIFKSYYKNNEDVTIVLGKRLWYDHMWNTSFTTDGDILNSIISNNRWGHKSSEMNKSENQLLGFNRNSTAVKNMCNIYFQEDVLKVLNENQFIIDEVKYKELRAFGQTDEKENLVLMMELMSNCDYDKSLVHLLFLLKEFGSVIGDLKEAQHVNFKGLLSYLNLDLKQLSYLDINKLTSILRKHKKFTRKNVSILGTLCSPDYINYDGADNACWINGPVLKTECIELIQDDTDN